MTAVFIEAFVGLARAGDGFGVQGVGEEKAVFGLRRIARPLALPARADEAAAKEGAGVRGRVMRVTVFAPAAQVGDPLADVAVLDGCEHAAEEVDRGL